VYRRERQRQFVLLRAVRVLALVDDDAAPRILEQ
jgi:hypothetical protein